LATHDPSRAAHTADIAHCNNIIDRRCENASLGREDHCALRSALAASYSMNTTHSEQCNPVQLLLVEDSSGDARLTLDALHNANEPARLHAATNRVEALSFVRNAHEHAEAPDPSPIFLDLDLPKFGGREDLVLIKEDNTLKTITTGVLFTSFAEVDTLRSYQHRAKLYLAKPVLLDGFESLVTSTNDCWLKKAELPQRTYPSA
jgi:chemotaxis family two-component system response regulator Rcp1